MYSRMEYWKLQSFQICGTSLFKQEQDLCMDITEWSSLTLEDWDSDVEMDANDLR